MELRSKCGFIATFGETVYTAKKAGEKVEAEGLDAKRLIGCGLAETAEKGKDKANEC